jgi:transcriptional regulator with XRE-family HTH domain
MNEKDLIQDAFDTIAPDSVLFISKIGDIADRIQLLLDERGWTQKDLAVALHKNESEVSKWLTGIHNFTVKSLAKMEAVLGADIINVPTAEAFTTTTHFVYLKVKAYSNDSEKAIFENTPMSQENRKSDETYLSVNATTNQLTFNMEEQPSKKEIVENESLLIAS